MPDNVVFAGGAVFGFDDGALVDPVLVVAEVFVVCAIAGAARARARKAARIIC
jgi:hypothetical protein